MTTLAAALATPVVFPLSVTIALLGAWILSVVSIVILYFVRIRPLIQKLKETDAGRRALIKAMFPPRFHK
jgi:hypothetical protein